MRKIGENDKTIVYRGVDYLGHAVQYIILRSAFPRGPPHTLDPWLAEELSETLASDKR